MPGKHQTGARKRKTSAKQQQRQITAVERREMVLELRRAGYTYNEIANDVGVTPARCCKIVKDQLAKYQKHCEELTHEIRLLEIQRLDGLFRVAWDIARSGGRGALTALERAVTIQERRAKLLGLDAPERQEISGPDGGAVAFLKADLSQLSDEELMRQQELSEKAYGGLDDE